MVRLSKIYTKTGDAGETMLGDGDRVAKSDARVEAYGEVDEANCAIGLAVCGLSDEASEVAALLRAIQNELFDVGADLCAPITSEEQAGERLRIDDAAVTRIERLIDEYNANLKPLDSFVLPGGSEGAARLHFARTVVRRAERRVASLLQADRKRTNPRTLTYLNRLSDLLFVLGRHLNDNGAADVLWKPGGDRSEAKDD